MVNTGVSALIGVIFNERRCVRVEKAMWAVLGGSVDAVLDWMMLHVPRNDLPLNLGGDSDGALGAAAAPAVAAAAAAPVAKRGELRDYEFGTWKGKFPKTLLNEWCQKKQCAKPQYNRSKHKGAGLRFKVAIEVEGNKLSEHKKASRIEIECPEACKDELQGQHLAATYALYSLNKTLALHTLLPPTYRAAWERWLAEEKGECHPGSDFVLSH